MSSDSLRSALPATVAEDQPSPRRNRPRTTIEKLFAPEPETANEARRISCPRMMVFRAPNLSLINPNMGERAYMPATCKEIVNPTSERECPVILRWAGVIDITETMTMWLRAMLITAKAAIGFCLTIGIASRNFLR